MALQTEWRSYAGAAALGAATPYLEDTPVVKGQEITLAEVAHATAIALDVLRPRQTAQYADIISGAAQYAVAELAQRLAETLIAGRQTTTSSAVWRPKPSRPPRVTPGPPPMPEPQPPVITPAPPPVRGPVLGLEI